MLLTLVPWTSFWDRNRFADLVPLLGTWMGNAYVRGAVTGVGVITTLVGLRDLVGLLFARSRRVPQPEPPAP